MKRLSDSHYASVTKLLGRLIVAISDGVFMCSAQEFARLDRKLRSSESFCEDFFNHFTGWSTQQERIRMWEEITKWLVSMKILAPRDS